MMDLSRNEREEISREIFATKLVLGKTRVHCNTKIRGFSRQALRSRIGINVLDTVIVRLKNPLDSRLAFYRTTPANAVEISVVPLKSIMKESCLVFRCMQVRVRIRERTIEREREREREREKERGKRKEEDITPLTRA